MPPLNPAPSVNAPLNDAENLIRPAGLTPHALPKLRSRRVCERQGLNNLDGDMKIEVQRQNMKDPRGNLRALIMNRRASTRNLTTLNLSSQNIQ